MLTVNLTDHAAARLRQRGVPDHIAATALEYADREVELGGGCVALSLTRKAYTRLRSSRGSATADRAKSLLLVIADNTLISVMHRQAGRGRCYARP